MTAKKQLREQVATLTYIPSAQRNAVGAHPRDDRRGGVAGMPPKTGRRVMVPEADEASAYSSYVERRIQRQRSQVQSQMYTEIPSRTRSKMGVPASSVPARYARLAQQQYTASAPMPVRRRTGQRRNFLMKLLGLFAILLVGIFVANFALTSSTFRVEQVNIVGTHNTVLVKAIQHLGIQGQNIFLLNVAAITARIEASPMVATASLSKQWPNSVVITVQERVPVLLWQTKQGTYSVDSQGVVIALAGETTGVDQLRTVVDMCRGGYPQGASLHGCPQMQPIHPGARLKGVDIAFVTQVFKQLPKVTGATAFTLRYDDTLAGVQGGSYVIVSQDGWIAYLGSANDANPLDNRLIELQQILNLAQQQNLNLATIDLRFGLRPVYTLKS